MRSLALLFLLALGADARPPIRVQRRPATSAAAAPTVTLIDPGWGLSTGQEVTITGTGFSAGATVSIGGSACTSVVVVSATSITCTAAGPLSASPENVTVTNTDTQSGTMAGSGECQGAASDHGYCYVS